MTPWAGSLAEWLQYAAWAALVLSFLFTTRLDRWLLSSETGTRFRGGLLFGALGITVATFYADEGFYWSQLIGGFWMGVAYIAVAQCIPSDIDRILHEARMRKGDASREGE